MTKLIIDADSLLYMVGHVTQEERFIFAKSTMHSILTRMAKKFECTKFSDLEVWIARSGCTLDRAKLYPEYKANRADQEKPKHFYDLRKYLLKTWRAHEARPGWETDDEVARRLTETGTILAGIDKDLLQVPGRHYNWNKDAVQTIDQQTAWYNFYTQVLTGDTSDNIPGAPGVGAKGAAEILAGLQGEHAFQTACVDVYEELYGEWYGRCAMDLSAHLLYLKRSETDEWRWIV